MERSVHVDVLAMEMGGINMNVPDGKNMTEGGFNDLSDEEQLDDYDYDPRIRTKSSSAAGGGHPPIGTETHLDPHPDTRGSLGSSRRASGDVVVGVAAAVPVFLAAAAVIRIWRNSFSPRSTKGSVSRTCIPVTPAPQGDAHHTVTAVSRDGRSAAVFSR